MSLETEKNTFNSTLTNDIWYSIEATCILLLLLVGGSNNLNNSRTLNFANCCKTIKQFSCLCPEENQMWTTFYINLYINMIVNYSEQNLFSSFLKIKRFFFFCYLTRKFRWYRIFSHSMYIRSGLRFLYPHSRKCLLRHSPYESPKTPFHCLYTHLSLNY